MKRTGIGGGSGRGLFGYGGGGGTGVSDSSLKYYCMNCGTQHAKAACPKCGSKLKRVGS